MKRLIKVLLVVSLLLGLCSCKEENLPLPEVSEGMRGDLGIDKNINEETIDNYLNRKDSVYRDMRMQIDDANYEAIGGDSYLSGFVKGFEVVPYPYICNVEGLPEEVGSSYTGVTLFSHIDNEYRANYEESLQILEELFPKNKTIFLMCGGGGYAGMMKKLLVGLGWDENKIYNVGGYWYYQGKNNVDIRYEQNGNTYYDFDKLNYHDIDFDSLTMIYDSGSEGSQGEDVNYDFINLSSADELRKTENEVQTFALFVYLNGCSSCAEFSPIVKKFAAENNIDVYSIELHGIFDDKNSVTDRISYAPSLFIYKDGQVIAYLDSSNADDYEYYKSLDKLTEWVNYYIEISELQ